MIRYPAGFDGEIRIKRYMDYYQASYGVMMLSSGQFGAGTAAGYLLGSEPSGYATDFTAGGVQGNALVRSSPRNTQMDYSGTPFLAQGGPVTFSRGSLATVTDSDGYINWAQHNLLLASEQFDASNWTKSSSTVAANSIAAPDNAVTADTIAASGANGTVLQSYTAVAVPYVFGVWLRRKTGAGNIQIAADNGTYTTVTITNDWALYTVTQTPTAGTKSAGVRIVTSGDEVYAWGAHLYRSDLGGMQANASAYPYYNSSTPKNLLGYTESIRNADWITSFSGAPVPTKGTTSGIAPNGLTGTIDTLTLPAVAAPQYSFIYQNTGVTYLNAPITFSVYARVASGSGTIYLNVEDFGAAPTGGNFIASTAKSLTTEWQRISVTGTRTSVSSSSIVVIGFDTRCGAGQTNASPITVELWGAQLSDSASLDPYTPNFGAAPSAAAAYGPRLDYDPSTLAAKGLLVEEQRTNLLLNSATLSTQSVTVTATAHTLSFYGTGTVTLSGASSAGPLIGTGVYPNRVTLTFTPTAGTLTLTVTGTVSNAQLEAGAFATSYIPTAAATVTRNADVASVGVSQFPYSATEGSIVANVTPLNVAAARRAVQIDDGTENERYTLSTNSTPNGLFTVIDGGSSQAAIATGTPAANTDIKLAARYKVNDFALSVNGGAASTDTSGTLPIANLLMRLGSGVSSAEPLNGHIRQITYIPRRLTNAELQARTA